MVAYRVAGEEDERAVAAQCVLVVVVGICRGHRRPVAYPKRARAERQGEREELATLGLGEAMWPPKRDDLETTAIEPLNARQRRLCRSLSLVVIRHNFHTALRAKRRRKGESPP